MAVRCSVCKTPALAKFVDASPDLSAAALSRQAESLGMDLTADRILNHRKHREEEVPVGAGVAKTRRDIAIMVQERVAQKLIDADEEELDAILFTKGGQGALNAGLKAQTILDKRDMANKRQSGVEVLAALLVALEGRATPLALPDPNVIEGEAVEVAD